MSDLDKEELIATRKLHGLDDDLFKEDEKVSKKEKELINNQYIELDNSREVIDKLTQENNKQVQILNIIYMLTI